MIFSILSFIDKIVHITYINVSEICSSSKKGLRAEFNQSKLPCIYVSLNFKMSRVIIKTYFLHICKRNTQKAKISRTAVQSDL